MRVLQGIDGLRQLPPGMAMSIGNFDGVHRGHARLVERLRQCRAQGASGVAIVTFEPHPLTALRPEAAPARLTPWAWKEAILSQMGCDYCVILPPTPDVLNLTAEAFWQMLRETIRPSRLVEGRDFTFGKGRGGDVRKLIEWARGTPVEVELAQPVLAPLLDLSVVLVSSSLIRWLLGNGRVRDAAICLGRPYRLIGEVVEGFKRGRTIGVPTANLRCQDQLIPRDGVYAGRCIVEGTTYPVALNLGPLPTLDATARQLEAHLIGFSGDLYGKTLEVDLVDWLRDQRKFGGIDALKQQLGRDVAAAGEREQLDPSRPIAQV